MNPQCEVVVVTCIDFRYQRIIELWLHEHIGPVNYDRVAYPGAAKDRDVIAPLVMLARRLHNITRVVLINHDDCGAYGAEGTNRARHEADLRLTRDAILAEAPDLTVELYFAMLHGDYREDPLGGTLLRID